MAGFHSCGRASPRPRRGPTLAARHRAGSQRCGGRNRRREHRLPQHHSSGRSGRLSWQFGVGTTPTRHRSVERHDDGHTSQQAFRRHWGSHFHLRLRLARMGIGVQSLFPREGRRRVWRSSLLAGSRFTRRVRTCLDGRSLFAGTDRGFPTRSPWRWLVLVPTPSVDA